MTAQPQPSRPAPADKPAAPGPKPNPGPAAKPGQPAPKPLAQPPKPPGQAPGQPPAAKPGGVNERLSKPVRPAFRRWRHVLVGLSFLACVALPSAGVGTYLWAVAADQYASRTGFSVRREESNPAAELLGGLTSLSGSSSTDTDILYEYIQSQRLVADIDDQIDLHAIWSKPDYDPVFSIEPDASIEKLLAYWKDMVRISYSSSTGLIEVEVRAFTPEDATLVAQTLFDESAEMINQLSDIAREDAIRYAREELDESVEQVREAREALTLFRNQNQIVDPEIDLRSQSGVLSTLEAQQAETLIEIDLLRETVPESDPRLAQARRRLAVIEERIAAERRKLGFEGNEREGTIFADLVGEYERLVVDREFAEQAYVSARAAYDSARAEARRKTRYLAAYMEPTRAETAEYPRRLTLLALVSLFLFLVWSVAVLVIYSVKDRR
ncbi:hypothetical protein [Roseivivax sp. CAU 1761]